MKNKLNLCGWKENIKNISYKNLKVVYNRQTSMNASGWNWNIEDKTVAQNISPGN